jgi:hypothetical protein
MSRAAAHSPDENGDMALSDVSTVELTVWLHEHCDPVDDDFDFAVHLRAELAARGGEADGEEVRKWLEKRLAQREQWGSRFPTRDGGFARTAPCACGAQTHQVRHGYTAGGSLWKGHVCACSGWQCNECGRIIDRAGLCCR